MNPSSSVLEEGYVAIGLAPGEGVNFSQWYREHKTTLLQEYQRIRDLGALPFQWLDRTNFSSGDLELYQKLLGSFGSKFPDMEFDVYIHSREYLRMYRIRGSEVTRVLEERNFEEERKAGTVTHLFRREEKRPKLEIDITRLFCPFVSCTNLRQRSNGGWKVCGSLSSGPCQRCGEPDPPVIGDVGWITGYCQHLLTRGSHQETRCLAPCFDQATYCTLHTPVSLRVSLVASDMYRVLGTGVLIVESTDGTRRAVGILEHGNHTFRPISLLTDHEKLDVEATSFPSSDPDEKTLATLRGLEHQIKGTESASWD